ncbi:Arc family DNA-binding protein [Devosia sp. Root635]|uniref:Arc family DNA-binding protein n=1 Tax=Devosia sp. Root635 TaxID=1736575 RepID=UPI0009E78A84|nr:Arc family DNA-binding protein [Devosia sp. Root635]
MARGDYPSAKQDQYMVRFPDGMRDQLKGLAEKNGRSMNAEIIARLDVSLRDVPRSEQLDLAELAQLREEVKTLARDQARRAEDMRDVLERQLETAQIQNDFIKSLMADWVDRQDDQFRRWMLAAMDSVQQTKADPEQVKVIEELREQFIRERQEAAPLPPTLGEPTPASVRPKSKREQSSRVANDDPFPSTRGGVPRSPVATPAEAAEGDGATRPAKAAARGQKPHKEEK